MSWYIQRAGSKEKLIADIEADPHIPSVGKRHILEGLQDVRQGEGETIIVESNGHLDSNGGNSQMTIKQMKLLACLALLGSMAAMLLSGCVFGKSAAGPTGIERALFEVQTNMVPQVTTVTNTVTNTVTVVQTNVVQQVQVQTLTNSIGVPVLVPVTNYHTVVITNVVQQVGQTAQTVTNEVGVPQLAMGTGAKTVLTVAGAGAGLFGWGGLVTTVLSGLMAGYLKLRNNALSGQATVLNQTAGALTQNIETLLQVLQTTPQGQAAMPYIKNYLMQHQTEAGVIQSVAGIIETFVNEPAAKQSAQEIVSAIGTIQSAPTPAKA